MKKIINQIKLKFSSALLLTFLIFVLQVSVNNIYAQGNTESSETLKQYSIIYNVLTDEAKDNYEVFSMDTDGRNKMNITGLPGVEWSYFSDGPNVYFISDKDTCHRCEFLYVMNYKGENVKKVSDIQLADSWMSSRKGGSELIVKPHNKTDSAFYIIDLNGNLLSRIETGLPYSSDPLFINDGDQIVFRGGLTKSKLIDGFNEELYVIDSDGSNRVKLTNYPESDTTAGKFDYKAGTPKLHPSGDFITYQSKQDGKYSIYAVDTDGSNVRKLTDNKQNEGWHSWSPDGKWLVIELFNDDQTQFHIGLMNRETKDLSILTDTEYKYQQSPDFVLKNSK